MSCEGQNGWLLAASVGAISFSNAQRLQANSHKDERLLSVVHPSYLQVAALTHILSLFCICRHSGSSIKQQFGACRSFSQPCHSSKKCAIPEVWTSRTSGELSFYEIKGVRFHTSRNAFAIFSASGRLGGQSLMYTTRFRRRLAYESSIMTNRDARLSS